MKKFLIIIGCIFLYLASTVPVGMLLYALKMNMGIDMFHKTGFHGYMQCLWNEAHKTLPDSDEE